MRSNPQTACKAIQLLVPGTLSADTTLNNSTPNFDIDTLGFDEALVIVYAGATATLVGDFLVCQLKETDTAGSAYSDITGAQYSRVTGTGDNATKFGRVNLEGRKRYLSATLTETGTFSGEVGIMVVLFGPKHTDIYTTQAYDFSV